MENKERRRFVDIKLIPIKCLLFVFFGGVGCLITYLDLRTTLEEKPVVSWLSPIVSIVGPFVATRLVDGLEDRYARMILPVTCIGSVILYSLLLINTPEIPRDSDIRLMVSNMRLSCDRDGATIFSNNRSTCYSRMSALSGCSIPIENCVYVCPQGINPEDKKGFFPSICSNKDEAHHCVAYTDVTREIRVSGNFETVNSCARATDIKCKFPMELEDCTIDCRIIGPFASNGHLCENVSHFWLSITIRIAADTLLMAAIALLNAATFAATQKNGDVGRQLLFGFLGFVSFRPLLLYLNLFIESPSVLSLFFYALPMIIAAAISAGSPECWRSEKSTPRPLSTLKILETFALVVSLILLSFFSKDDPASDLDVPSIFTLILVLVVILWKSETLVDYCGHNNLITFVFTLYIIIFTLQRVAKNWAKWFEDMELLIIGIVWITGTLYIRHLLPISASAQALPVIAYLCIGRFIRAIISLHSHLAEIATIVAISYFVIYSVLSRCYTGIKGKNYARLGI